MDIFKFHNDPSTPSKMQYGEIINGLTSKTWIERYVGAGEFTLKAPVRSNLRKVLPLGTYISHINTREIMVVENHQITGDSNAEPDVVVTGRSFEVEVLENRAVYFPGTASMDPNYTWIQAKGLIDMWIHPTAWWVDPGYEIPWVVCTALVSGTGVSESRPLVQGELYKQILDLLKIDNLGIKIVRPTDTEANTAIVIYKGIDRSKDVTFTYDSGEIVDADYLWSRKLFKNVAIVDTKWSSNVVDLSGGATGIGRRVIFVDASFLDNKLDAVPSGSDWDTLNANAVQFGKTVLAAQNNIALTKAQVTREGANFRYRKHFDLGDLVSVHGNYDERRVMRVSEYVEIEDDTGAYSYPTLSIDGGTPGA